ncbi:MAG: hypothetical protein FJ108_01380 [Deltaproteobacteria bacterium]|nr:hypothetical protein [Deltaproteobacteria bacterium]
MRTPLRSRLAVCLLALCPQPAAADSTLSGVCPDGSVFVVQSRSSVPCANPRFVDAADLPPLRPHLLPRPYTWYVDQETRNPNNPYNLVEAAEKIRAARLGTTPGAESAQAAPSQPAPAIGAVARPAPPTPPPPAAAELRLADDELRDLVRLIGLRQADSPAQLEISDARGDARMRIQLAYSASFESWALASLGLDPSASHVFVFATLAESDTEFQPNFFVVQGGRTYRPDPTRPSEIGFLLGESGALPAGELAVGYLVVPASFEPHAAIELFWNDRSVETVLAPATGGAAPSR